MDLDITRTAHRAARRREQNRLNQRARRESLPPLIIYTYTYTSFTGLRKKAQTTKLEDTEASNELRDSPYGVLVPLASSTSRCSHDVTTNQQAAILLNLQIPNYLILTQLNVWQATLINSLILGISHFFADEDDANGNDSDSLTDVEDLAYIPHYLSPSTPKDPSGPPTKTIPPSLMPTTLQKTVPHFPWIDLVPLSGLRDSLIRAGPGFKVHEFCMDMMGDMFGNSSLDHSTTSSSATSGSGFLVWGDSWMIESWEMTEGFVQKWGWLLDEGCEEIVRATNRWRERRGEDVLVVCA